MLRCGPDAMHRGVQLALHIYAKIPLIPRSLFLNGVDIEENECTGTLTNGRHKIKATFEDHDYGIFVRYQLSPTPLEH